MISEGARKFSRQNSTASTNSQYSSTTSQARVFIKLLSVIKLLSTVSFLHLLDIESVYINLTMLTTFQSQFLANDGYSLRPHYADMQDATQALSRNHSASASELYHNKVAVFLTVTKKLQNSFLLNAPRSLPSLLIHSITTLLLKTYFSKSKKFSSTHFFVTVGFHQFRASSFKPFFISRYGIDS